MSPARLLDWRDGLSRKARIAGSIPTFAAGNMLALHGIGHDQWWMTLVGAALVLVSAPFWPAAGRRPPHPSDG